MLQDENRNIGAKLEVVQVEYGKLGKMYEELNAMYEKGVGEGQHREMEMGDLRKRVEEGE